MDSPRNTTNIEDSENNNIKEIKDNSIDHKDSVDSETPIKDIKHLKKYIPEKLDSLTFSNYHFFIIATLGISWVLDGYEVSLLSVLSGVLKNVFKMTDSEIGLAGSIYLLGCVTGSLFFGFLASKFGRKKLFSITLGIYVLSIIATSVCINKYMFFFCRFFTGLSVGGEYSSIFAAIDELIPKSIRGRADLIIDGTWHFGSTLAALVSYLTLNYFSESQELVIRFLFVIGVIMAFPVIYMRRSIPESPRWLIYRGRYQEALTISDYIVAKCKNKYFNSYDIYKGGNSNSENKNLIPRVFKGDDNIHNEKIEEIKFKEIFDILLNKERIRFFYGLILMASQAFFYNGIFYTYTLVLQTFYHISKETVGLFLIPLSVASFLGPLVLGKYFDSWSRRKMIALTFSLSGILLIITAVNFITNSLGFVFQQILWFMTFFVASPAASSAHLTISEIFPLEMRSQAMAIFFSLGLGIGGVIAPFLYGNFVQTDNKSTIFFSYTLAAIIMIFASIFGYLYGVDCENKSLEQISENIKDRKSENY
jgi:MFS family permease